MKTVVHRREFFFLLRLFAAAVAINYLWEMAQMPLFKNMPFNEFSSWILCFRASLGDGLIVLSIWGLGVLIFRQFWWFRRLTPRSFLVLVLSGALIAIAFEVFALATDRWEYSALMPILPVLDVGLSPFIQLLILPILSMRLAARVQYSR